MQRDGVGFVGPAVVLPDILRKSAAGSDDAVAPVEEACRIAPAEYRARRRLARIFELIEENSLGFKEIAEEVGMHNVTHLHAFLRERCNTTPGNLRKACRSV